MMEWFVVALVGRLPCGGVGAWWWFGSFGNGNNNNDDVERFGLGV